jgi:hypothetical protein
MISIGTRTVVRVKSLFSEVVSSSGRRIRMVYPNIAETVRAIAEDTQVSPEVVSKLYSDVWAEFEVDARIRDYIPLFVAKRVREQLKSNFAKAVGDGESCLVTDTARVGVPAGFPENTDWAARTLTCGFVSG